MKKLFYLIIILFVGNMSLAQFQPEDFKAMDFRNIGPAGMSGRITAIDVDLSHPDRIFVGSASGGLWLSENGGISWEPIFDDQPALSIGSVAINQKNPDVIWVGTGEGNPRNSVNTGGGIFKSIDGGKTWTKMGLDKSKAIHRIIIHRDYPDIVYAAALGSPWGEHKERGVFRTTDGGKTWENILYVNDLTGPGDMVVDPDNPNKMIVGMWEHKRTPWDFISGGEGSGLYLTYDGGETWKKITSEEGLPKGDLGRIGLAFAPSKSHIVYALIEAEENGLYKSIDGGENWSLVSKENIGNRPFYYSDIFVDPHNENRIFNLFTFVSLSEDGGKTFRQIADYGNAVHPDHHAFWIHPDDPSFLMVGNDGGMNISRDGGKTFEFIENIPVGQFYHVNIDNEFPYNVYGGMQDNGSWIGPAYVLKSGGIRNYDWQELYFGDGFDVMPHPSDSRYGYAMSQGGNVGMYDRETGRVQFVKPFHPEGKELRYNWNAAIAQDPFNECGLYFGSQYVHYSDDCGLSWDIISPDLTTNDTTKQNQDISGGLTIDATNAENHTTILAIAPSPIDNNTIWVGTDDGNLQITRDGGKSWTNVGGKLPGLPPGSWIPQIEISHANAGEAFVVANNYRRNDYNPYVFHTTDFGNSWRRIVGSDQISHFVVSFIQDDTEPNLMFLGTDGGLYGSFDRGENWELLNEGFPRVQVSDLKIHPREGDLVIGTFGRAFWVLDDINPLRAIAREGEGILNKEFLAFPPQDAYQVSYRSYDGIRFNAQGDFVGDNRSMGQANLSLWVKPSKADEKNNEEKFKNEKKEVTVKVVAATGDTIRTFTRELEEGLNRIGWRLDRDGIRYPSRRERRQGSGNPGGADVMPGAYKLIYEYLGYKDSAIVEVKLDPRVEHDLDARKETEIKYQAYEALVTKATDAFDQMLKARKSLKLIEGVLKVQQDTSAKALLKISKEIQSQLDSLEGLYMLPEGLKGIQRNPDLLSGVLRTPRRYFNTFNGRLGQNALNVLAHTEKETERVTGAVNLFFEEDWKAFQEEVEQLQIDLFSGMKEDKEKK